MLLALFGEFLARIFKLCGVLRRRDLSHTPKPGMMLPWWNWYLQKASLSFDTNFLTSNSILRKKVCIYSFTVPLLLGLLTSPNWRQFATTNFKTYNSPKQGLRVQQLHTKNLVHGALNLVAANLRGGFGCVSCGFLNWRNVTVELRF